MSLLYIAVGVGGIVTCSAHSHLRTTICAVSPKATPPWQISLHIDEAGEDGCPDAIELTALGAATVLRELYLALVEHASDIGSERVVERVCGWSRGGGCTE